MNKNWTRVEYVQDGYPLQACLKGHLSEEAVVARLPKDAEIISIKQTVEAGAGYVA